MDECLRLEVLTSILSCSGESSQAPFVDAVDLLPHRSSGQLGEARRYHLSMRLSTHGDDSEQGQFYGASVS